jgi:hypothetical protein
MKMRHELGRITERIKKGLLLESKDEYQSEELFLIIKIDDLKKDRDALRSLCGKLLEAGEKIERICSEGYGGFIFEDAVKKWIKIAVKAERVLGEKP